MRGLAKIRAGIFLGGIASVLALTPHPVRAAEFTLYARAVMEDRKPSVKVTTNIPYSSLVFLKSEDRYEARYRVYMRVFDAEGKRLLDTAVINERVTVENYVGTRSHKRSSNITRRFYLKPGDYIVRCNVRVKDTHRVYAKESPVNVPDFLAEGLGLSNPGLFAVPRDTMPEARVFHRIRPGDDQGQGPRESAAFAEFSLQPAFRFDVYLDQESGDSVGCEIVYEITDQNKMQLLYGKKRVTLTSGGDHFVVAANVDDWNTGSYRFRVKAMIDNPPRATTSTLKFALDFTRAVLTRHFQRTIEVLSLIGTPEEIQEFRDAPEYERINVWARFWKRRDPTPGTGENEAMKEHIRRVRHAELNFSVAGPGWRSDRGKVYIKHGEPDEVSIRSDPYRQGTYLVWRYYQDNLTFEFFDQFGLGEYRLWNTATF